METLPLELERLSGASRRLATRLLARVVELGGVAQMVEREPGGRCELVIDIPSPTGERVRTIGIWMEGDEASLEFGNWHTHATLWLERDGRDEPAEHDAIATVLEDIVADRLVALVDVDAPADASWSVVDPRDETALVEELTHPLTGSAIRLISWSGRADRLLAAR